MLALAVNRELLRQIKARLWLDYESIGAYHAGGEQALVLPTGVPFKYFVMRVNLLVELLSWRLETRHIALIIFIDMLGNGVDHFTDAFVLRGHVVAIGE